MREVRIFELEHDEPAAAWRVARPSIINVVSGEIGLTVAGEHEDHWLAVGQSIELARGATAWISAGQTGARFALASGSGRAVRSALFGGAWQGWFGRRPGVV